MSDLFFCIKSLLLRIKRDITQFKLVHWLYILRIHFPSINRIWVIDYLSKRSIVHFNWLSFGHCTVLILVIWVLDCFNGHSFTILKHLLILFIVDYDLLLILLLQLLELLILFTFNWIGQLRSHIKCILIFFKINHSNILFVELFIHILHFCQICLYTIRIISTSNGSWYPCCIHSKLTHIWISKHELLLINFFKLILVYHI